MFCEICHKFNHDTEACFKNPTNQLKSPIEMEMLEGMKPSQSTGEDMGDEGKEGCL